MKARALLIPAVVALFLAGCGDDKKSDTTTADTTAATTAETTAQTTAETTAETTAPDPVAERVAAAQEIEGTYTGTWTNTTFNSVGTIDATFIVDATTAVATLTMDLGGNVFGAPDPDAVIAQFDLSAEGPYSGTSELFGDYTISYSDGHLSFTALAVPGVGGRTMTLEGDFSAGAFTGTYIIVDLAEGTFEATRA